MGFLCCTGSTSPLFDHDRSVKKAILVSVFVSAMLAIVKVITVYFTNSISIQASALDSCTDVGISLINFFIVSLTQRKNYKQFPLGFDKLAALTVLGQVLVIGSLCMFIFKEGLNRLLNSIPSEGSEFGVMTVALSVVASLIVVFYQRSVVKRTGSLIVRAEMLHYLSDCFTNMAILCGFFFMWFLKISWLDIIIGMAASCYVAISSLSLAWNSFSALIDAHDIKTAEKIALLLQSHNYNIPLHNIFVRFSGTRHIVQIKLPEEFWDKDVSQIRQSVIEVEKIICESFINSSVSVII